ncbi:hypothetical protein DSOUD_0582 [Desulfuromonas soudanensis]|uniref:Pentapeptide repeat-containing protein n=1 Tax=Desulfuromonas soudanensis TaxID=1603606 RepID=A0A0M4CZD4_9BACT|nr:pentapeptide repeat-containing protein [Desulfuromonas soudanensis]ALC15371.1 hypothetical protein DSOUD_0582 [Desulfuromonas soudanensis]
MNIFQSDFQKNWQVYFTDTNKLNEYTSIHIIELKNVEADGYDLDGAVFNGAMFENNNFKNISAENSKFKNARFKECKFINCKFWSAEFTNVVFEDCEFISTTFLQSKMINVTIVNGKALESEFDELEGTELLIISSEFKMRSSFTDSKIPIKFQNTNLSGVNMMGMTGLFPLSFEGGVLDEVNFGKSYFSEVTLCRVKQGEGGIKFNSVTAKSISFEDVEMLKGVGMGWANVELVRIVGGELYGPSFKEANIAKTVIRDAYVTRFATGHMGKVEVANSTLHRSGLFEGEIQELSVVNSTIDEIVGKNFKADTVLWDNVTLNGKIDLTNAQVKDFRPTRIQRGPDLQLITTGSNMKF